MRFQLLMLYCLKASLQRVSTRSKALSQHSHAQNEAEHKTIELNFSVPDSQINPTLSLSLSLSPPPSLPLLRIYISSIISAQFFLPNL
jgi:hypothetical protein